MDTVRTSRPVYVDRLPPCNAACPAGENVQAWLAEAQAGRYRRAWELLVRDNPLPAIHGRVCYHPCETSCNREAVDAAVNIHAVERFLGDQAIARGWSVGRRADRSGQRVLVVGAGPAGLSAAWHLSLLGHDVTIHDAGTTAGGMMRMGIPRYRLPRDVLDAEVHRIEALGVTFVQEHTVRDLAEEKARGRFDAVFVAAGAHLSRRHSIPARDAGRIYEALSFLRSMEGGPPPAIGRRVAVYGGGNTAMDAAQTARRLGAEPVIIYRRTRAAMPAHPFEADEAVEEGVTIHWLRTITRMDGTTLVVEVMALDERGFPRGTGQFETLEADSVILALGQDTDTSFMATLPGVAFNQDGTVVVGPDMQTGCPGIFAGGDMAPLERTITTAVGHGRKGARSIDAWLRGEVRPGSPRHEPATLDTLRLWYHTEIAPRHQPRLDPAERTTSFSEVVAGLDEGSARFEAGRCLSCGNCFECDGCYAACPETAVLKLGPGLRYDFDFSRCTGCGLCFDQCPCGAITMIPEPGAAASMPASGGEGAACPAP